MRISWKWCILRTYRHFREIYYMSGMSSMDREKKKRQLRNNIVQTPKQDRPPFYKEEEDSEGTLRQALGQRRRKKTFMFLVLAVFLTATGFCWYQYQNEYEYTEYDVSWEQSMRFSDGVQGGGQEEEGTPGNETGKVVSDSSFVQYEYFGDNMIKYTKDGASYIDASGKTIWTQGYEMKTPIINVNGDYAVIADQQGNQVYICNREGCTGVAKTQLPITKAAVSARGVTAAVVEDSTASYVFYFKKDGEELGIYIKMLLSGDGYPIDLALSPDGKQVVMSVAFLKNGALKNKVVFYDFSEIGKNVNNRFIGAFEEEFDGKMVARVRYLNEETVCAFSDKGMTFISVKNVIPDTTVVTVPVEEEIKSICYSGRYAGVVVDNASGSSSRLDLYSTDGKRAASVDFDYPYSGVEIDGDKIILYNEESCRIYNLDGHKKFDGQFDFPVSCVRAGKNHLNSLIVAGSDVMKEIKLK